MVHLLAYLRFFLESAISALNVHPITSIAAGILSQNHLLKFHCSSAPRRAFRTGIPTQVGYRLIDGQCDAGEACHPAPTASSASHRSGFRAARREGNAICPPLRLLPSSGYRGPRVPPRTIRWGPDRPPSDPSHFYVFRDTMSQNPGHDRVCVNLDPVVAMVTCGLPSDCALPFPAC